MSPGVLRLVATIGVQAAFILSSPYCFSTLSMHVVVYSDLSRTGGGGGGGG